jgi:AcrR family transcriptional regulator
LIEEIPKKKATPMSPRRAGDAVDRSRRKRTKTDDSGGRGQIIDAAIASILEVGFYRSSTNEIARRANVSWGALQYHFGTREALWVAVLKELDRRFVEHIEQAEIEGDTTEERVTSLYNVLARHYDSPTFLVRLQIVLNLQHDPDTSAQVTQELGDQALLAQKPLMRLMREAIGRKATRSETEALFHAVRGFAFSQQFARAMPIEGSRSPTQESLKLFLTGLVTGQAVLLDEGPARHKP